MFQSGIAMDDVQAICVSTGMVSKYSLILNQVEKHEDKIVLLNELLHGDKDSLKKNIDNLNIKKIDDVEISEYIFINIPRYELQKQLNDAGIKTINNKKLKEIIKTTYKFSDLVNASNLIEPLSIQQFISDFKLLNNE
jgi:hypothetical protein